MQFATRHAAPAAAAAAAPAAAAPPAAPAPPLQAASVQAWGGALVSLSAVSLWAPTSFHSGLSIAAKGLGMLPPPRMHGATVAALAPACRPWPCCSRVPPSRPPP